mgnify:CR=1 FL=1
MVTDTTLTTLPEYKAGAVFNAEEQAKYREYKAAAENLKQAQGMLQETDAEIRAMAEEEVASLTPQLVTLEEELKLLLLPKDPNDERNIFLEVRAGTGGDESALFAGDLLRMYTRFAERHKWQAELISESASDLGGYKEVIARLVGQGVYARLKFESGGHRVQRVPATESQGRIHTSACTVAVMAEPDEAEEVQLNPADLRFEPPAGADVIGRPVE